MARIFEHPIIFRLCRVGPRVLPFQFVEQNMELAPDGVAFLEKLSGKQGGAGLLRTWGAAPAAPHSCYQSNRTVSAMTRGVIVPAARVVPVAVYLPVLALVFTEFSGWPVGVVYVNDAFRLVNCTSLNTL